MKNKILHGDALTKLKELKTQSIDMVMTSPPYWALRDYGVKRQLGLEPTFDLYIKHLCDIFDEVKRVLKDIGTCWVNIGDTYSGQMGKRSGWTDNKLGFEKEEAIEKGVCLTNKNKFEYSIPSKCLTLIPFRFVIEMVNRGWILRNIIIWHKPNCMPSSIKDRFTVDFEYLFFFSKKKKYYFETQYECLKENTDIKYRQKLRENKHYNSKEPYKNNLPKSFNLQGRNKRTVWSICSKPFKESHFAVYPEELCETPIKAGCPKFVCKKCGKPKEKISIKEKIEWDLCECGKKKQKRYDICYDCSEELAKKKGLEYAGRKIARNQHWKKRRIINSELKPTCNCKVGFIEGIILDPFFGAGTTGLVALKQNKKFLGIELNKEYIKIAKARLKPFLEQRKLI